MLQVDWLAGALDGIRQDVLDVSGKRLLFRFVLCYPQDRPSTDLGLDLNGKGTMALLRCSRR